MNEIQKAAYINAMAACAQIEMHAMEADGKKHTQEEYEAIIYRNGISHNQVISYFTGY